MRIVLIVQALCFILCASKQLGSVISKKSKLCGNEQCDEVLFIAKVKRAMDSNHEAFLPVSENDHINVTAVRFSDRTDLMEGVLKDGRRGNFYIGSIDIGPYVKFLQEAILNKKEMMEISQDRADKGHNKFLGTVRADLEFVRDYNIQATRYAEEHSNFKPELFPLPDDSSQSGGGQERSHGGVRGHSHVTVPSSQSSGSDHLNDAAKATFSYGSKPSRENGGANLNVAGHSQDGIRNVHTDDSRIQEAIPNVNSQGISSNGYTNNNEKLPSSYKQKSKSEVDVPKINSSEMDDEISRMIASDEALSQKIPFSAVEENLLKQDVDGKSSPTARLSTEHIIGSSQSVNQKSASTEKPPVPSSELKMQQDIVGSTAELTTMVPAVPTMSITSDMTAEGISKGAVSNQPLDQQIAQEVLESVTAVPTQYVMDRYSASTQTATTASPVNDDIQVTEPPFSSSADATVREETTQAESDLLSANAGRTSFAGEMADRDTTNAANSETNANTFSSLHKPPIQHSSDDKCGDECPSDATVKLDAIPMTDRTTEQPNIVSHIDPTLSTVTTNMEKDKSHIGFVGKMLKSVTAAIKSVPFLDSVDDAGIAIIVNMSFLVAAVIFHFVSSFLFDFDDSIISDRMITHDLATKCKLLDEQNKIKDVEISRLNLVANRFQGDLDEAIELRKELCSKQTEIQDIMRRHENLKCELEEERRMRMSLECDVASERKHAALANEKANESRRLLDDAERSYSHTMNELSSTRKTLERLEKDLQNERNIHEETVLSLKKASDAAVKLRMELQAAHDEIKKLQMEKNNVEFENATLSSMIEEIEKTRKEGSAGESGGSGGWSDFGDDIIGESDDKEKASASSTVTQATSLINAKDVREAAKLRAQLKKTEQEFDSLKAALNNETEDRRRLESKSLSLENELERKKREVEERERDRSRADERCNELLAIMKDNNVKLRETELLRDKLRDEVVTLKGELASAVEDKIRKEEKIVELEADLKRMRNEHLKLETRRFNEVMELKRKMDLLQTNQKVQSLASASQAYDINPSASSLERDIAYSPVSLWEEPPRPMSSKRTTPEDCFPFGNYMNQKKGSARIRRSDIVPSDNTPSDGERRKERKESSHRRVRSRSSGRQLWSDRQTDSSRYMSNEPSFPPLQYGQLEKEALSRRHNRGNVVYYSSGGSNGGRSPPPEMPLLSAVPPPGVKKPAGKRAIGPGL